MCGIVGQIRTDGAPVDAALIQRMCDAIAHRGPDGEGQFVQGVVGLGHRRLSIIDLAGGAQPMSTADAQVWITFNGEIYNYRELRTELEGHGHTFRTSSDTEVLLYGWRQWGAAMLPRLRGMFAFCIVDLSQRKWLMARDPFGIKPLCYRDDGGAITFASELQALKRPDDACSLEAIEYFLRYLYIPGPDSIYRPIRKLPPGHSISGDLDGGVGKPVPYWQPAFEPLEGLNDDQWLERFESTLRDSVRAHLIADVPLGVLLSGGVDSTLVACAAAGVSADRLKAFTLDFEMEGYSEVKYATRAAQECGLDLKVTTMAEDFWSGLPLLVRHYGEPFGDISCVPTWKLSSYAREHVPVVLSGDGGDELFGGYRAYKRWMRKPDLKGRLRELARRPRAEALWSVGWALAARIGMRSNRLAEWERLVGTVDWPTRKALWQRGHHGLLDRENPAFALAHGCAPQSPVRYGQHMDIHTYLPGAILVKSDIASMFHGLEIRTPLLDMEVMKLAAALPDGMRYRPRGHDFAMKFLPKLSLLRKFDDMFVNRRKKGFGGPGSRWFRQGAPGFTFLREVVLDRASGLHEWFDMKLVENWIESPQANEANSQTLWLLLVLGLWRKDNAGNSVA